jgi:hypothetical protein
MARDNLELSAWGDGTVRLSFWDSDEGKDRIWVLRQGQLCQVSLGFDENDVEQFREVDLVTELHKLVQDWKEKYGT